MKYTMKKAVNHNYGTFINHTTRKNRLKHHKTTTEYYVQ